MNLKGWFESKRTKDALVGVGAMTVMIALLLYASGGDPEKFEKLLKVATPYSMSLLTLLGIKIIGQSHTDGKLVEKGMKKK